MAVTQCPTVERGSGLCDSRPKPTDRPTASLNSKRMPTLSETPLDTVSPDSLGDEYSLFDQVFGANLHMEGDEKERNACDNSSSSSWGSMISLYLPIFLLWLRRSVLGATSMLKLLMVGHLLRLVFGNFSQWVAEKWPTWIHTIVQPPVSNGKLDLQARPPPALVALALLTVVTLIVHPDGLTWIMFGKLKNAFISSLRSLAECCELVISDYGVMPTIVAFATLATLLCLLFIILRTLSPRKTKRPTPVPQEKKKRKRKGQRNRGHGSGRIKHTTTSPPSTLNSSLETIPSAPLSPRKVTSERTPDLTPLTPGSASRVEDAMPPLERVPSLEVQMLSTTAPPSLSETGASVPIIPSPARYADKEKRERNRVSSVSTVDTTAMSDDLSCGSTSIRSFPSVSASSMKSSSGLSFDQEALIPTAPTSPPSTSVNSKPSKACFNDNNRRHKRAGSKPKKHPAKQAGDGHSRWDALKSQQTQNQSQTTTQSQNKHHGDSQQISHRQNNRRGGGRGSGPRKQRNGQHPHTTAGKDSTMPRNNQRQKHTPSSKQRKAPARSPVSPPVKAVKSALKQSSPKHSQSPSAPPGLAPIPSALPSMGDTPPRIQNLAPGPKPEPSLLLPTMLSSAPSYQWNLPKPQNSAFASAPTFNAPVSTNTFWNDPNAFVQFSQPRTTGHVPFGSVKENPFAPEPSEQQNLDKQIEAELQELGGQMAGSILDF